jgi:hypothetical protein
MRIVSYFNNKVSVMSEVRYRKAGAMKHEEQGADKKPGSGGNRSIYIGGKARFQLLHDTGHHPAARERYMTRGEVQFGLRYNTFNNGCVIIDLVAGSRHEVVIKNVFKPTNTGGMLALLESQLQPPHPLINPKSYDEQGRYIPG